VASFVEIVPLRREILQVLMDEQQMKAGEHTQ